MVPVLVSRDVISKWTHRCYWAKSYLQILKTTEYQLCDDIIVRLRKPVVDKFVDDCHQPYGQQFLFQRDGAPADAASDSAVACSSLSKLYWQTPGHQIVQTSTIWLSWLGSMKQKLSYLNPQPKNILELKYSWRLEMIYCLTQSASQTWISGTIDQTA